MGSLYLRRVRCVECPGRACRRCRGRGRYALKTIWAKWYVDGRPIRRSCETATVREAKAKLDGWTGKAAECVVESAAVNRVRFGDLKEMVLADYRTNRRRSVDKVEDRLRHLERDFAGRRAVHIGTPDVVAYIERRQGESAANATINRELAVLKRGFTLAVRAGALTRRPWIPGLRERNVRQGFVGDLEALAIQEALPVALRPLFRFLYTFGWRREEAQALRWEQVSLVEGTVRHDPRQSKTEDGGLLYLTAVLLEDFRALWQAAWARARRQEPDCAARRAAELEPHVFTRAGRPIRDFRGAWEKACEAAGCPALLVHDLRRSAVRNLVRAGVPERVAMAVSGHRTRSVFDRYNIVSEADLAEAARRLQGAPVGGREAGAGTVAGTIEVRAEVGQDGGAG